MGFTFPNPNQINVVDNDFVPSRPPLKTTTSTKYSQNNNGTYPNKRKLRSFMQKRPAQQQRHSISTPIEYQNDIKHDDDDAMQMIDESEMKIQPPKVEKIDANRRKNDSFMVKVS